MIERFRRPEALDTRLFFAQVREDPLVELDALSPDAKSDIAIVSSGGCTALSILGAGAGRVTAIDLSATQNHMVELKAEAVRVLDYSELLSFIGATTGSTDMRALQYKSLRQQLTSVGREYWDKHESLVASGLLNAGVTERFLRIVSFVIRRLVHNPDRIHRLFESQSLEDQRKFFAEEWDSRRWRLLFTMLINKATFRKTYDPAFFAHIENESFAKHFYEISKHVLTDVPIENNYFFHHILEGVYPSGKTDGLPPYLQPTNAEALKTRLDDLVLVDGSFVEHLRVQDEATFTGFALSNIMEWLDQSQIEDLFEQIVRTAKPDATLVFRNFVGWTEVPEQFRDAVVEDKARGEELIKGDRSGMQRRVAVCTIRK